MSLLSIYNGPPLADVCCFEMGAKQAGDAAPSYALSGMLYKSDSGWVLLSVPNALVRGVFAAMDEPGVELPVRDGGLEAHISVMSPEEVASLGGPDKITERGKRFSYRLGGLVTVQPDGRQHELEKAWLLRIFSPELQALRRSYGLSSLPNDGKYAFHCTIAVRKKGVLGRNDTAKATAAASAAAG
jgi:hypothetical protein